MTTHQMKLIELLKLRNAKRMLDIEKQKEIKRLKDELKAEYKHYATEYRARLVYFMSGKEADTIAASMFGNKFYPNLYFGTNGKLPVGDRRVYSSTVYKTFVVVKNKEDRAYYLSKHPAANIADILVGGGLNDVRVLAQQTFENLKNGLYSRFGVASDFVQGIQLFPKKLRHPNVVYTRKGTLHI